jgi:MFS family permease
MIADPGITKSKAAYPPWVILATSFGTMVVIYGVWYSYSVFLVALIREFGWSRSVVSGGFAFFSLMNAVLGPPTGWLIRRWGPRRVILVGVVVMALGLCLTAETREWWHLYVAYGLITGLGMSLNGWIPQVILIQAWFPRRVGSAMGIASAGIGVGIFALVPLSQLMIEWHGWRWAFRLLAAVTVVWGVPSALWWVRDPPGVTEGHPGRGSPRADSAAEAFWTLGAAVHTRRFWALCGMYFFGNAVTQMLMIHQVAYLVDHRLSALTAASVGGFVGLVSIGGKIGWGVLSDRTSRELACTLGFGCVLGSLGGLVLAGAYPDSPIVWGYAVLIALGYGVLSPVFPATASDLYRGPGFATIYGTLWAVVCLGLAAGPWIAGQVFDLTASYALALWIGLAMALATPVLVWIAAPRRPNIPPA